MADSVSERCPDHISAAKGRRPLFLASSALLFRVFLKGEYKSSNSVLEDAFRTFKTIDSGAEDSLANKESMLSLRLFNSTKYCQRS